MLLQKAHQRAMHANMSVHTHSNKVHVVIHLLSAAAAGLLL
jgi:hypothetical protein